MCVNTRQRLGNMLKVSPFRTGSDFRLLQVVPDPTFGFSKSYQIQLSAPPCRTGSDFRPLQVIPLPTRPLLGARVFPASGGHP
jgi:hypothetical protein